MLRPAGTVEPLASKLTAVPTVTVPDDAAMLTSGAAVACAAATAAAASSMPAPQTAVVQMHSLFCGVAVGVVHTPTVGSVLVVGNALALLFSRLVTCATVRFGFTDSISATVP